VSVALGLMLTGVQGVDLVIDSLVGFEFYVELAAQRMVRVGSRLVLFSLAGLEVVGQGFVVHLHTALYPRLALLGGVKDGLFLQ